MVIKIRRNAQVPIYRQISTHISQLIGRKKLLPGDRLPDTRTLSCSLGVSRNTVVAAYNELESKGLIFSHVGKGTFVERYLPESVFRAPQRKKEKMTYEGLFSSVWEQSFRIPFTHIEQTYGFHKDPESISFASDLPDPEYFPYEEFNDSIRSALRKFGTELLNQGHPMGFRPLLEYLPLFLAKRNITCESGELMIVNGVQQGLSIVGKLFVNPGDTVVLENLTYPQAMLNFKSAQADLVGIPVEDDGLDIDFFERVLKRRRVKLLYTIPTYQNPTGTVMSVEKRERLVELCRKYRVVVVEDDYAHELNLEKREVLPIKAWDESGCVVYMGSLSNILFPGIRLSWILAPKTVCEKLALIKRTSDLYTSRILQGALLEFYRRGYLEKHIKKNRFIYRRRRDVLCEAIERYFPEQTKWQRAEGGIFQWVDVDNRIDVEAVFERAKERGVLFAPDTLFFVEEWKRRGLRLSFSNETEKKLHEGVSVIGNILKEMREIIRR
jgi:DNA-binding transcriptional MocR family regulator